MFDRFESRLELQGWLTAETAFRIGAGRSTEVVGADLPVVRDALGKPYIPGSSFKGVLRSRLESFARTVCDERKKERKIACNPVENTEWCITHEDMSAEKQQIARLIAERKLSERESDIHLTEWVQKQSCLPCLTFGSPWLSSKVLVRDLLVDESLWFEQFQVRNGVAINRDTETADEGKLYDYEVVPSGVRFGFRLVVENGEPWQWGMVLLGLKVFEDGGLAIGGNKSRGLGWVRLETNERKLFSLDGAGDASRLDKLFNFINGGGFESVSPQQIKNWINEFKKELTRRAKEVNG